MRAAGTAFVAATVTGAVLTPAVRSLSRRFGALDHALTSRKVHGKPIPRLGGIAIVLAFYTPLVALLFTSSEVGRQFYANPAKAVGLFVGGISIAALGVYDDLRGANARKKFLTQFAVAALMYWVGFRVNVVANPFGHEIHLGFLGLPFTMLWIAGVINAMNLIDGLDGLAGGVALIAVTTTFSFAAVHGDALMPLFMAALAGAVLGFLFYNFNPASIFMGDTGSMFLGFVLSTTSIQTGHKSSTAVAIVVPIIALGVPIADTLLAMLRRAARGVPIFTADRGHIHHRLMARGWSHREAVLVLYGASVILGLAALALTYASSAQTTWVLIALSVVAYAALRALGYFNLAQVRRTLVDRKRNIDARMHVRKVGEMLRTARNMPELWTAARSGASAVGAAALTLSVPRDRERGPLELSEGFDRPGLELFRAKYRLLPERPGDAFIEIGWSDGRCGVDRDDEIAIEQLCEHLCVALERLGQDGDESFAASANAG